jgi:hypothetical protein
VLGISLMAVVLARLVQRWRDASPPLRRPTALVFLVGGALLIALSTVLATARPGGWPRGHGGGARRAPDRAVVHDPTLLDDPDEVRAAGAAALS